MGIRARGKEWFREDVLANHLEEIDPEGPRLIVGRRDVQLGQYGVDYIAHNSDGGLTVVEFEVSATRDVLGRMLLNPRAIRQTLQRRVRVRSVLVATHLDWGVVELCAQLRGPDPLIIRLALEDGDSYRLVTPDAPQSFSRGAQCIDRALGPAVEQQRSSLRELLG